MRELLSGGARQQHPPQRRQATTAADLEIGEAEIRQQPAQRPSRVEMKMIAERLGVTLDAAQRDRSASVRGRRQQEATARDEYPPHLGQPAGRIGDVLDHLTRPYERERTVLERKWSIERYELERKLGMPGPCAGKRRFGDIGTDHVCPGRRQQLGEIARATAEVEHALARRDPRAQQEVAPAHEFGRREVVRKLLPEVFEEVPQSDWNLDRTTSGDPQDYRRRHNVTPADRGGRGRSRDPPAARVRAEARP